MVGFGLRPSLLDYVIFPVFKRCWRLPWVDLEHLDTSRLLNTPTHTLNFTDNRLPHPIVNLDLTECTGSRYTVKRTGLSRILRFSLVIAITPGPILYEPISGFLFCMFGLGNLKSTQC